MLRVSMSATLPARCLAIEGFVVPPFRAIGPWLVGALASRLSHGRSLMAIAAAIVPALMM